MDGAALNNVPIHLARDYGCDVIVVLKFKCAGEGRIDVDYSQWVSGLQRFMDILVDENARKTMRDYEYFNNDLEREEKIKRAIKILESGSGHTIAETQAATLLKNVKLSASGRRKIKLIIVDSEEIPEFHFSNFSKNAQREAINKGYESFWNVKDKIAEAIEL